jgi:hypothetical protein
MPVFAITDADAAASHYSFSALLIRHFRVSAAPASAMLPRAPPRFSLASLSKPPHIRRRRLRLHAAADTRHTPYLRRRLAAPLSEIATPPRHATSAALFAACRHFRQRQPATPPSHFAAEPRPPRYGFFELTPCRNIAIFFSFRLPPLRDEIALPRRFRHADFRR